MSSAMQKDPTRLHRLLPRVGFWKVSTGADQEGDLGTEQRETGVKELWLVLNMNFLLISSRQVLKTIHLYYTWTSQNVV